MVQSVTGGYGSYCAYGFESTYGTGVAATRPFGHGVKVTINRKNNMDRIHSIGYRNAQSNVAKKFEGSASVEFLLSHGTFMRAVLGAVADGGSAPYTHTYTEANTIPSITIANAAELGAADYVSTLVGGKISQCTINAAVGEVATVKLEVPFKDFTLATSTYTLPTAPSEDVFTFANGTISVNGTTVGSVQSVELTINNNIEMLWGLGSRLASAGVEKIRTYDIKMTVAFSDITLLLEKWAGKAASIAAGDLAVLNPAGVACVLTFTNGLTSSSTRSIVFTFANLYLNEHSLPLDVNEVIKEDVTGYALSCTNVVWSNNTSADNASP